MNNPFLEPIQSALGEAQHLHAESRALMSTAPTPNILAHPARELPAWFAVNELASASVASAVAEIAALARQPVKEILVNQRLAALWFGWSIHPQGWALPAAWDASAGDYRTTDGWIKLHTNAPHHRAAALTVLESAPGRENVERHVLNWPKVALEEAIVAAGGCAAAMHSASDWDAHPQGRAVAQEPLIHWRVDGHVNNAAANPVNARSTAPLAGVRILDLTRVLAGPVASRTLARFGAEVLRIDPPTWQEPGVVPEVTLGKRCAQLDLHTAVDRSRFESLLRDADVLLHGYRLGALAGLGYDRKRCQSINPSLIDVSLCAYGHSGPWAERRGFDSLVQMSSGIADYGQQQANSPGPVSLPVQALDHATGYLLAAAVARALRVRQLGGEVCSARLSLARTAQLLRQEPRPLGTQPFGAVTEEDLDSYIEHTRWGTARRLRFPVTGMDLEQSWPCPASDLRTAAPRWQTAAELAAHVAPDLSQPASPPRAST